MMCDNLNCYKTDTCMDVEIKDVWMTDEWWCDAWGV